ncbi:MAG: cryptochrome/photolyase family protein [Woeseiaceae bacterium]
MTGYTRQVANIPANTCAIVWFRQDLRLADNPALNAAVDSGARILPVYILDDVNAGDYAMGGASRWWLHHSLAALDRSLDGGLLLLRGDAKSILPALAREVGAATVYWNRCYEPWRIERDTAIRSMLSDEEISVRSFNGSLLFEPMNILKADRTPYKVFTPFYRKGCLADDNEPRHPLPAPTDLQIFTGPAGVTLADLGLLPDVPWHEQMDALWQPGEAGASQRLNRFLETGLDNYKEGRNRPDLENVSRLSPHLHFGELSPNQVWHAAAEKGSKNSKDLDHFHSELGWREFSYNLLYHFPALPHENLQRKFNRFPWRDDTDALERWQRGQTGVPMVDAGMRELWRTGYMHNRVRMIAASFLVKNLMLDWRHGEKWFRDTLVDADLASNSASWQWVAGCGTDAAPYFRIFNPVTQGNKFDPDGSYVREYVPEVRNLSNRYLHSPWEAPAEELKDAGITLGADYPLPLVDLKESRQRALDAFSGLSGTVD